MPYPGLAVPHPPQLFGCGPSYPGLSQAHRRRLRGWGPVTQQVRRLEVELVPGFDLSLITKELSLTSVESGFELHTFQMRHSAQCMRSPVPRLMTS